MGDGLFILGGSSIYLALFWEAFRKQRCFSYFARITLYGRDLSKLAFNVALGQRMAKACGAKLMIDFTLRLEDCLSEEYTMVFNQIRFGGLQARDMDEKYALKNQLFADETLGIVGVSNAIRTIAMLRPILETLAHKKNEFLFLNFTNPCSIVSQYVLEYFHFKTVGICDYPNVFKNKVAVFLGYNPERVHLRYFGLNHFAFIYDILVDQKTVLRQFKERMSHYELYFSGQEFFSYIMLPSWEAVFAKGRVIQRQNVKAGNNRAALLLDLERKFSDFLRQYPKGQDGIKIPPVLYERNCQWYEIGITPFFKNFFGGGREGENILNIDAGDIFDLGMSHCIVETNTVFIAHDPVCAEFPDGIRKSREYCYVRQLKMAEQLLLKGILSGEKNMIIESCLINPMIQDVDKVQNYFLELARTDQLIGKFFANGKGS